MIQGDGAVRAPICVIDVGAPKTIGWALVADAGVLPEPRDVEDLMAALPALVRSAGLSLGFEAPLFSPRADSFQRVTAGRRGDGARAWSAGAGATVTTIGMALMVHVLERLRGALPEAGATLDFTAPPRSGRALLFEAVVSGAAQGAASVSAPADRNRHPAEAACAARADRVMRACSAVVSAVTADQPFSPVGAVLPATGWRADPALRATPCLVAPPRPAAA